MKYDYTGIEKKWQDRWENEGVFHASEDHSKPKFYGLVEFPYPSGAGMHVGHIKAYSGLEVVSRKRRMQGYNVLFPIGFDAYGLPTENYAIKTGIHPRKVTDMNIEKFSSQLKRVGFSFDWNRVVDTTEESYYKWTQWIFLKLFEKGLAYKAEIPINWCTECKVGLANEEVVNGVCERCGGEVIRKVKSQWMLKITDYAQKLLDGLDNVDFIEIYPTSKNSYLEEKTNVKVSKIKLALQDVKVDKAAFIADQNIKPGVAALAEFEPVETSKIVIKILSNRSKKSNEPIGISEIVILAEK